MQTTSRRGTGGRLRRRLRQLSRWYAMACARDDAHRMGFVVPDRLPHRTELRPS